MIEVARDVASLRAARRPGTVGFVPTMGALHAGHLSLVRCALDENDACVVSIFVNPTQFDDPADLAAYPSTFADDCGMLEQAGAQLVFAPTADVLYGDGYKFRVTEIDNSRVLEGEHRLGHFDGVLTVVLKLLNIVGADRAYFGEKDAQQLMLVKRMTEALFHPTVIVGCPTIREADRLAMSSRNRRLSPGQRALAGRWAALLADATLSAGQVRTRLEALGFTVDYIEERWGRRLGAVFTPEIDGGHPVRLIDNVPIEAG